MSDHLEMLDGLSLAQELRSRLGSWSDSTGVVVEIWALPTKPVAAGIAEAVRWVLGEALGNVEKHSSARHVSVAITTGRDVLKLTVVDDGRGFHPGGRHRGRGLVGMSARFAELGGTCSVDSAPGQGATVSGTIPLTPPKPPLRG
ncbi:sensor histidine kinase [Rhizohabitans arisaemae]|uniref:sensor histidine kinase n=1 Tax=Rhizohabitans arisaemae TaxID=2720610 RepID=UPI0024B1C24A|nr:ATP-binding protein [Rhizohabitans arisaemae]